MDTADEVYRVNTTEAMCTMFTECKQQKSKCNVQSRQSVQNVHNRHGVQNEQVYNCTGSKQQTNCTECTVQYCVRFRMSVPKLCKQK